MARFGIALILVVVAVMAAACTSAYHGKIRSVKGAFPAATRSVGNAADRFATAVEKWAATK